MADENKNLADQENNDAVTLENIESKAKEKARALNKRFENVDEYTLPDSTYTTPEMGDYYLGAIDDIYLRKIDEILTNRTPEEARAREAAFYTENPKHPELGYHDGSIFLKGKLPSDALDCNWMNGETIRLPLNSIDAGSPEATEKFISEINRNNDLTKNDSFTMQMYGLNAPTMNRYAYESSVPTDKVQYEAKNINDIKNDSNYVYDPNTVDSSGNGLCNFVKIGSKWYQMNIIDNSNDKISFKWLVRPGDGDTNNAFQAQQKVKDYIDKAGGEVYIQIDREMGTKAAEKIFLGIDANKEVQETLEEWAGNNVNGANNGYCLLKQDAAARRTGIAYVKIDDKWVNLAKAVLAGKVDGVVHNPDFNNPSNKNFDQDYDQEAQVFADAYFKLAEELDDRKEIQQDIFGKTWDELHDWTVTIGDTTLLIPPTSIQITTEVEEQRVPILRASGSMPKSGKRDIRTIAMDIFFSGEDSINGRKYEVSSPKGKKFTYSLNGLRSLVAQFKFTPFVPIENKYLNETLGIQAVIFNSLSIETVSSVGPKIMHAVLMITEFDYTVYMPEVAIMGAMNNNTGNWFSTSINWAVMRYYYQRCIMAGNEINLLMDSYKDENGKEIKQQAGVNSEKYIIESLKHKTALQPMKFESSGIKFYIADQDYLEKMLEARKEYKKNRSLSINFDEDQKNAMNSVATSLENIYDIIHGKSFQTSLEKLNKLGRPGYKSNNFYFERTNYAGAFINSGLVFYKDNKINKEVNGDKVLNNILGNLLDEIKNCPGVASARFVSNGTVGEDEGNYIKFGIEVSFSDKNTTNEETIKKLKDNASALLDEPPGSIFEDGKIIIPLSMPLETEKTDGAYRGAGLLTLDDEDPDMKFLRYCINYKKKYSSPEVNNPSADGTKNNGDGITSWKKSPNLAQLDSIKYVPYDCGDFVVSNFTAQLINHQSRINIQDVSGSTPQYLGGEDIQFKVTVVTTDKETVSALGLAPKKIGAIMRRYREIIPCSPFKVDSEFTRFLGVNEVVISNVEVNTVPNQPGVYSVVFTMISTDRTLRNREAMEMIEANNDGERTGAFWENKENEFATKGVKSYFDFEYLISQAELYPDLELPRLDEMLSLGWDFVRYKFQDSRVYVDPDFYFVYLNQLSSQFLRDAILESINHNVNGTGTYIDNYGAQMTIKPEKFCGYTTDGHNAALDKQLEAINGAKSAKYKLNAKYTAENLREHRSKLLAEDYEGWDICNDIKAMFMESRYKKEYDSYVARLKTQSLTGDMEKVTGTADDYSVEQLENMSSEQIAQIAENMATKDQPAPEEKIKGLDNIQTEGKWVNSQLDSARAASKKIQEYLENTPINIAIKNNGTIRSQFQKEKSKEELEKEHPDLAKVADASGTIATVNPGVAAFKATQTTSYQAIKTAIQNATGKFFTIPEIREALELLNFEITPIFLSAAKDIIFSAACAATGEKEYSNKKKSTNWMPAPDFIGVSSGGGIQDNTNATTFTDVDSAVENATEFGAFKIKQYTREEFVAVTEETPENPWNDENNRINTSRWLLDRYYRYQPEETIAEYKRNCINSPEFCTHAFLRNVLYWIKNLVDNQALPSINADVLRKAAHTELQIEKKEENLDVANREANANLQENVAFFSKNTHAIDAGKLWTAACLAGSDGNKMLRSRIHDRDYRALNEYTHGCSVPKTAISIGDKVSTMMRKMNLALIGLNRIKDSDAMGVPQDMPAVKHARDISEKKYVECAEDPEKYMLHSCHDMIVHDARGRMLRAFPTYYMIFIDEGREVGRWHLHDNFYNSMSIMEFSIIKDRKNPADTANIRLSNIYQSYATEEEDRLRIKESGWGDFFESIFSPTDYGKKLEDRRRGATPEDRIRLRAGARIHLRAGYGSNAAMMPILFNGIIAEVTAQDTIDIIAQGDGIELTNPIMEKEDVHDISNDWTLFKNGDTPKNIMSGLLNYNGGWLSRQLKNVGRSDLLGDNPFGIYHFGNKDFTYISPNGECCQNIYEAWSTPSWGDGSSSMETPYAPIITMDAFGKTVWDIANICKSVMPDFLCAVAPFNLRSTLFIGAPRYYYAYDYANVNGAIQEKRKPFQQYHVYTSGTDIIANGMAASSQKMKTTATGLYQVCATFNTKEQHTVGPIYADIDIYPENQKSMIVDTQLLAKGVPYLGAMGLNMITSFDTVDKLKTSYDNVMGGLLSFMTSGAVGDSLKEEKSNSSIAWRMTASALKDSIKEMYCGDIVVLGDPSIKPHDRVFLLDNYNGISGQVTAKEVVHHMSVDDGFITTVSPDCINVVEDRFEHIVHNWFNHTGGVGAAHLAASGIIGYNVYMIAAGKQQEILTLSRVLKSMTPRSAFNRMAQTKYGAKVLEHGGKLGQEAIQAAKKAGTWGKNAGNATKIGAKVVSKGGKALGLLGKTWKAAILGTAAGPYGTVAAIAATLAAALATEILGTALSNMINDFLRDLQAITVFPVTRYGLVWTAGLQGSKGMIFGSPSYNEQGAMTSLVSHIISPDTSVLSFLTSFFFDDDTRAIADSLKEKNGYDPSTFDKAANSIEKGVAEITKKTKINTIDNKPSLDEMIDMSLFTTAEASPKEDKKEDTPTNKDDSPPKKLTDTRPINEKVFNTFKSKLFMATGHKNGPYNVSGDYRRMQMIPRADFSRGNDVAQSYYYFRMMNPKKFQSDVKLKYNALISDDLRLKPYMDEDFFKIIHQYPNLDLGKNVESKEVNLNGAKKYVKIIVSTQEDGALVYDMPMLNPEAINILYEIIRRAKNNMPAANSSDPYESFDETKNSFITLESALRIGDTESYAAAGFTFILRGVENAVNPLRAAISELNQDILNDCDLGYTYNDSLFDVQDLGEDKIAIVVRMPKITNINSGEEPTQPKEKEEKATEEKANEPKTNPTA